MLNRSTLDVPMRFAGTAEQREKNRRTHQFDYEDGRCWNCDCRSGGVYSEWPCGETVPRVIKVGRRR